MSLDRRQFLRSAAAGALFATTRETAGALTPFQATSAAESNPAAPLLRRDFAMVTKIADGVYATIANPEKPECMSNGGILVGREQLLIVEGHFQRAGAALEVEAARMISKAPIRGVVDTHFHLDHTFGNIGYAEQHIPIMAHEKTAVLMKEQYVDWKDRDKAPLFAPIEKRLAHSADDADKKHKQEELELWKWMYDAVERTTLALPTESLPTSQLPMQIDLGGLTAVLEYHPGHTPTDLIIRVPDRDVVFTGDLLFNRAYPVCLDANMISWRKVLDLFATYDRRTRFVPGHQAVCGLETVRDQSALFDDLHAHAEKMIRDGANADEADRRYLVPKRFHDFHLEWGFSIGPAMRDYYAKLASVQRSSAQ